MRQVAIYVRVSSRSQGEESQLPDLQRYEKGCVEPVVWYRDTATGTNMDRPGWNRLETAVRAGHLGCVVVWRLDRLGRTARGLSALFAELIERKVGLVSIREGLDLATPAGRLMAHVIASVAQYETEVRSERQTAGIAAARERGVKLGRPKCPEGVAAKRVKVTPDQERSIRRLKAEGDSVASIARSTGLSRPTVYSVLSAG